MTSKSKPVIVDTNIVFSALLRGESRFSEILLRTDHKPFVCEYVIIELFKHKDRLLKASRLSEQDILRVLYLLLKRLNLYKEDLISTENYSAALALCADIDENDTPHVALTLELDGLLWTGDKKLKNGLQRKGFNRFFELDATNR